MKDRLDGLSPDEVMQRAAFHLIGSTIENGLRGAVVHLYASLCVCNDDALRRGLENRSLPSLLVFEHANLIRDLRLHGLKRSREDADFVVAIDGESHPIVVRPEAGGSLRDSAQRGGQVAGASERQRHGKQRSEERNSGTFVPDSADARKNRFMWLAHADDELRSEQAG